MMFAQYAGQLAALGTAVLFSFGSILFTISGRELGSTLLNRTRLVMAVLVTMGLHWITMGSLFPSSVSSDHWFWLGMSGFIGLALGDALLFQAFILIGPRLSMLIFALSPVLGAFLAWFFLGETLSPKEFAGIVVTIGGIAFVISERRGKRKSDGSADTTREYLIGILFALGGAMGQASGLVLSKIGLANDFPALSGNLIRLTVAAVLIWAFSTLRGDLVRSYHTLRIHPRATAFLAVAAFLGPSLGVWLSLIAIQRAPVGITSTLMSLTPIFLIPISYIIFREKTSKQAIVGTLIAFAGTALLFL